jgi:transketolase
MIGVAAGMALSGMRPVVYTITPFTTTRCYEQIRVDLCYHDLPVIIVGTGSGLSYAKLGPTHHSLEDLAIMRALPNMRVLAPCDASELRGLLRAAFKEDSPVYIRIGKKGEPDIYEDIPQVEIGKAFVIKEGTDITILSTGTVMSEALTASEKLLEKGISTEAVSFHTVKPLDRDYLSSAARRFKVIATIEEHGCIGGLGSAIAEFYAGFENRPRLLAFSTRDEFMHEIGSQAYARNKYGLTADNLVQKISEVVDKTTR